MVGLLDRFGDWLGIASTLRRHLERREPLKVTLRVGGDSIWMRSLIRWDELSLCQAGYPFVQSKGATRLKKWERGQDGVYRLDLERFPLLDQLGMVSVLPDWSCDLKDVHGLGASKSIDHPYGSMEEMVLATSPGLVKDVSEDALRRLLNDPAFKVSSRPGPECLDVFCVFLWDGKIWLDNSDASHRVSAAKLIAKQLDVAAPLRAKLRMHRIDLAAASSICAQYEWLAVSVGEDASGEKFFDALKTTGCAFLQHNLPSALPGCFGLLFPKSHQLTPQVVSVLRDFGASDLGYFMRDLGAKSWRNALALSRSANSQLLPGEAVF